MMYISLILPATLILLLLIYIPSTSMANPVDNITNTEYDMTEIEEENNKLMTIASNPNVSFGGISSDVISGDIATDSTAIKPAKLMVTVNKTVDCYASNDCWKMVDPRDLNIAVNIFHDNKYSLASNFPGSYLGKVVIFQDPNYFRYFPLYVEVTALGLLGNNTLSYDSCLTYLEPGEFDSCKISIKRK